MTRTSGSSVEPRDMSEGRAPSADSAPVSGAEASKTKGNWRDAISGNVLALGLVSMFTDISSEMIYPLLPVFFTGLVPVGTAAVYVGLMEGMAESTASLLKVFSGVVSDALGRRKLPTALGYGLSTLCRPAVALAAAGWHVVALRVGDRIGKGIRTSPRDALLSESVGPGVRGLAFGFHRAMDHLGAILGPLAALAVLYGFLGYGLWRDTTQSATPQEMRAMRWLFAIALLPGLAAMAALLLKVTERAPGPRSGPSASRADRTSASSVEPRMSSRLPGRFYVLLGAVGTFALGNSSDLFLVFYGRTRFQLGLLQVIGLWIVLHVSKIVFSVPGGHLSDRLGRKKVILAGWTVYALSYLGLAVLGAEWALWAIIGGYGLYYGLTEGAERALVADFVPTERRGRAYGLYHGVVGVAALPASLLFGVFWAVLGPRLAFGIGGGLAVAATVILTTLVSTRPVHASQGEGRQP